MKGKKAIGDAKSNGKNGSPLGAHILPLNSENMILQIPWLPSNFFFSHDFDVQTLGLARGGVAENGAQLLPG